MTHVCVLCVANASAGFHFRLCRQCHRPFPCVMPGDICTCSCVVTVRLPFGLGWDGLPWGSGNCVRGLIPYDWNAPFFACRHLTKGRINKGAGEVGNLPLWLIFARAHIDIGFFVMLRGVCIVKGVGVEFPIRIKGW